MRGNRGQSVLEVLLAGAIFLILVGGISGLMVQTLRANRLGNEQTVATFYTREGMEAVRSLKNRSFTNLVNSSGVGLTQSDGVWIFAGSSNVFEKYTRTIGITDVYRDGSGNIVSSGGILDPYTKKVTVTTNWNFSDGRQNEVVLSSYFTDWRRAISKPGGMLVMGNGALNSDAVAYRLFDGTAWGGLLPMADVDPGTENKALRAVRLFSSVIRNEKVAISRHSNGSSQFIYAQVYDGTNWGNVTLLATINNNNFLDVQNFDGAYFLNGDFVALYSDNSNIPKFRIWNGSSWSAEMATQNIGAIPNFIVLKNRSGTNELMAAFFDQGGATSTQYFNGGSYDATSWTLYLKHANSASSNAKRLVDFTWSPNDSSKGALVFSSGNDRSIKIRIFTANSSGGGSWGGIVSSPNIGSGGNRLGPMAVTGRAEVGEFLACDKSSDNRVVCFESDLAGTWLTPANNNLTLNSQSGVQRSFHLAYMGSGTTAVAVYSDNSNTPKYRYYSVETNNFGVEIPASTGLGSVLATVKTEPQTTGNDVMVIMGDSNQRVYSWLAGAAGGPLLLGQNGSSLSDFWYDYVWN